MAITDAADTSDNAAKTTAEADADEKTCASAPVGANDTERDANDTASLGAKIPWPDDETFANIDPEEALDLYLEWVHEQDLEPWDHQLDALLSIAAGDHVILGTPTGSGKSLAAMGMCLSLIHI